MPSEVLKELIRALPKSVLSLTIIAVIVYLFSFSAVAVLTERNVEFFPPKIGPGPKSALIDEAVNIKKEIAHLRATFSDELVNLNQRLADSRSKKAQAMAQFSTSTYDWEQNERGYESQIDYFNNNYIKSLENIENKIETLKDELRQNNMINK